MGQFIRETRLAKGLSLRRAASDAGITPPFLSDIERGRRFPSEETMRKLALVLGVEKAQLEEFDFRNEIPKIIQLLEEHPVLQSAFRQIIRGINEGKIQPQQLAGLLSDAAKV